MSSALDRLAELEAEVERRREAEDARRVEVRERGADLTGWRARLESYEREVGAGEREPDSAFEAEAEAALGRPGVTEVLRTPHGRAPFTEVVDTRAAARLEGATAAREDAEVALSEYAAANLDALLAEVAVGARADHEAVVAALDQLEAALEPVRARDARIVAVHRLAGARPPGFAPFRDLRHAISDQRAALHGVERTRSAALDFAAHPPDECGCGEPLGDLHLLGLGGDPACDACADADDVPDAEPVAPSDFRAVGEGFPEEAGE
jgi:hypothetical protein